jgi:hypothetical protein
MKKILLGLVILGLAVGSALADGVRIDWEIAYGAYTHNAPNVTADPSAYQLLVNYSVVWQLIYAGANGAAEVPNPANVAGGFVGTGSGADDVVWATRVIPQGGGLAVTVPVPGPGTTSWDSWMLWDGTTGSAVYTNYSWSTAGSVYQRIYEGTPAALSWYFDSTPMAYGTAFNSSNEHLSPDYLVSGTAFEGIKPNLQVPGAPIPEPATMGLMGLGALVMAIRRRRS